MSIKKNSAWNLAGLLTPSVISLFTIPVILHGLGNELFGLLTLIWVVVGYFSLFDLGMGRACTQFIGSSDLSESSNKKIIRAGFLFILLLGIAGGILLFLIKEFLVHDVFKVSHINFKAAVNSLAIVAVAIPFTVATSFFKGALEAFEDFKSVNILRMHFGILNFALPMIVVLFKPSLEYVVLTLVILRIGIAYFHLILLSKHLNLLEIYSTKSRYSDALKLIKFGSWISITNIIGPIMVNADRFLLSHFTGAHNVTYYTIPSDMLMRVLILPEAFSSVLFAKFSRKIKSEPIYALSVYKKSFLLNVFLMLFISCLIATLAPIFIEFWLGSEYKDICGSVLQILSIGLFFNAITSVPYVYIQASGNSKITASFHIIELIVYVPTLYYFIKLYGIYGASWAWVLRVFLDFILVKCYFLRKLNLRGA